MGKGMALQGFCTGISRRVITWRSGARPRTAPLDPGQGQVALSTRMETFNQGMRLTSAPPHE